MQGRLGFRPCEQYRRRRQDTEAIDFPQLCSLRFRLSDPLVLARRPLLAVEMLGRRSYAVIQSSLPTTRLRAARRSHARPPLLRYLLNLPPESKSPYLGTCRNALQMHSVVRFREYLSKKLEISRK